MVLTKYQRLMICMALFFLVTGWLFREIPGWFKQLTGSEVNPQIYGALTVLFGFAAWRFSRPCFREAVEEMEAACPNPKPAPLPVRIIAAPLAIVAILLVGMLAVQIALVSLKSVAVGVEEATGLQVNQGLLMVSLAALVGLLWWKSRKRGADEKKGVDSV